jgi:hypothetical protein
LFLNDGEGDFIDATPAEEMVNLIQPTMGLQVADIDLDGNWELFFGNGNPMMGYRNGLYSLISESGVITWIDRSDLIDFPAPSTDERAADYPYRSHGTVFLDFDNDKDIDLFIANGAAAKLDELSDSDDLTLYSQREPNRLFRNDGQNDNGWLEINVNGQAWNTLAIGTKISIMSETNNSWIRTHYVRTTSGFNSSRTPWTLFGLGKEPGPFIVKVSYNNGQIQTQTGVEANSKVIFTQ